jgi:hypothetical protein
MNRLRLVTRADLAPAARAVQAIHALREWVDTHPIADQAWYETSNTIAFLEVDDEPRLRRLLDRARERGIPVAAFTEPDLDDQLTAIVLAPGRDARRLCSSLPLALRAPVAQLAERSDSNLACAGSSPARGAKHGGVAQLVERRSL